MRTFIKTAFIALIAIFSIESTASAQLLKNLLKKSTETVTATSSAYTQGQTAGTALKSLYSQYQADGKKIDMKNLNNILSVASLAGSVQELKTADLSYKKEYAKGLILGSMNLVTEPKSTSVISGLTSLAGLDLSSLTQNTALKEAANEVIQAKAAEALSGLTSSSKVAETTAKASEVATKAASTIENASEIASSVTSILKLFN